MSTQEVNPAVERDLPKAGLGPKDLLLAMVGLLGSIITSGTAYVVAKTQTDTKIEGYDDQINKLIEKSNEFKRLLAVQAHFTQPTSNKMFTQINKSDPKAVDIDCSGTVGEDFPKDFHLWIAVEVDGYVFFKDSEIDFDRNTCKWQKTITEPVVTGNSKQFNLRLYATTEDGNYQINNWIRIGRETHQYEKIATISNTVSKDHADVLRIRLNP